MNAQKPPIFFAVDDNANLGFATKILEAYNQRVDTPMEHGQLGEMKILSFSDGELEPEFLTSVRGRDIFLIGSTNTSDNIMLMALAADAAKRASAYKINAIIPYYGYGRSDRKSDRKRVPIGAKVVANILSANGYDRVITVDLHANQIAGFFEIPVDTITGLDIFYHEIKQVVKGNTDYMIMSPDAGGVKRASAFFTRLIEVEPTVTFGIVNKIRTEANKVDKVYLVGDVTDKDVILIDDMVDTAGTLMKTAELILENGAKSVKAICSHGVLSGPAYDRLTSVDCPIDELWISDTLSLEGHWEDLIEGGKVKIVSSAPTFAKMVEAIMDRESSLEKMYLS